MEAFSPPPRYRHTALSTWIRSAASTCRSCADLAGCPCGRRTKRPFCAETHGVARRSLPNGGLQPVTVSTLFRRLTGVVLGTAVFMLPVTLAAAQAAPKNQVAGLDAGSDPKRACRGSRRPAAILPRAMPACSATLRRRQPITAPRSAPIRAISEFSSARSSRCSPNGDVEEAVRLAERSSSSTATTASRGSCSAFARSSRRIRRRAPEPRAVGARPDHRSHRDAAGGLGAIASAQRSKGAVEAIDKLQGADWYALFKDMHAGLILDLAGNKKEAGRRFERAYKLDSIGAASGRGLRLLAVAQRQKEEALKVFRPSTRSCRAIR